ncbi:hypothetical protein ASPTUDRAFT_426509 [Aspergillus tubingensis CBS 134.48]|uniref:Uncharacterized protein n=1 Tax=Aspergillus tubingensis (strain CBS 134.48) TaxID=767770 RepID=A0A1L9NDY7_ASPTC|nr:hypothetical protein ASPTUDRAFT_426509 [Aspergillus tubingensis CBS 134.48]
MLFPVFRCRMFLQDQGLSLRPPYPKNKWLSAIFRTTITTPSPNRSPQIDPPSPFAYLPPWPPSGIRSLPKTSFSFH